MPTNFPRILGEKRNDSSQPISLSVNGKLLHKDVRELDIRGDDIKVGATNDGAIIKFPEYVDVLESLQISISNLNTEFNKDISSLQTEMVSALEQLSGNERQNSQTLKTQITSISSAIEAKLAETHIAAQDAIKNLSNAVQTAIEGIVIPNDAPALQQIQTTLVAIQTKPERYDEILECIDETKRLITGIDIPEADLMPLNAKLNAIILEINTSKQILEEKLNSLKSELSEKFGNICLSVKSQFEAAFNEIIKAQDQHSNAMREDISLLAAQHNSISSLLEQNQKNETKLISDSLLKIENNLKDSILNIEKRINSIERKITIAIIAKANKIHRFMKKICGWTMVLLSPITIYCSVELIRLFCR